MLETTRLRLFRITITSHRWSWVNIYTEWTLGPNRARALVSGLESRYKIARTWAAYKGGPFGSPSKPKKQALRYLQVLPGIMYICTYDNTTRNKCTYNYVQHNTWTVSTCTVYGGATLNIYRTKTVEQDVPLFTIFCPGPPTTPLHLWHTLGGESSQQHSAYRYYILEVKE